MNCFSSSLDDKIGGTAEAAAEEEWWADLGGTDPVDCGVAVPVMLPAFVAVVVAGGWGVNGMPVAPAAVDGE